LGYSTSHEAGRAADIPVVSIHSTVKQMQMIYNFDVGRYRRMKDKSSQRIEHILLGSSAIFILTSFLLPVQRYALKNVTNSTERSISSE
jgi:hypothetical protein